MQSGWVRREFRSHGITQYPPGPHLVAAGPDAPAPVPSEPALPWPRPQPSDPQLSDPEPPQPTRPGLGSVVNALRACIAPADDRLRQYEAGAELALSGMAATRPDLAGALSRTSKGDIVVVQGQFDRVQEVLDRLGLPYTTVAPSRVARMDLDPGQILVANCPGDVGMRANLRIRRFVHDGGTLLATDWALRGVVQSAFPGMIVHNGIKTADAVVGVRPASTPHPLLEGAFDAGDDARWWLEIHSYPILVLARGKVKIVLKSYELMLRWGAAPVAVLFRHGKGEVFHMISHFYLQRTEDRPSRGARSAAEYAARKGASLGRKIDGMTARQLESATTSARLLANLVAEKRLRVESGS